MYPKAVWVDCNSINYPPHLFTRWGLYYFPIKNESEFYMYIRVQLYNQAKPKEFEVYELIGAQESTEKDVTIHQLMNSYYYDTIEARFFTDETKKIPHTILKAKKRKNGGVVFI